MNYVVQYRKQAIEDAKRLKENEPIAYRKFLKLIEELSIHPRTGTGKPEQLRGEPHGRWSRRINDKHRLVYEIYDSEVVVIVLTARGHYDDK